MGPRRGREAITIKLSLFCAAAQEFFLILHSPWASGGSWAGRSRPRREEEGGEEEEEEAEEERRANFPALSQRAQEINNPVPGGPTLPSL